MKLFNKVSRETLKGGVKLIAITLGYKSRYKQNWKYIQIVGDIHHIIISIDKLLNEDEVEKISIDKGEK